MNFLAHIYLSGDNDLIKVGNFVGDWVKGSDYKKYPFEIQRGILIHRYIDSFTDTHPIAKKSKNRFAGKYQKYSGIIVDICYDHFLSIYWNKYSAVPLNDYTHNLTKILLHHKSSFPESYQEFLVRFLKHKWIESYIELDGIEKVLASMVKFTSLPDKTADAMRIFKEDYEEFGLEFQEFFPQLIDYIEEEFNLEVRHQKFNLHQ